MNDRTSRALPRLVLRWFFLLTAALGTACSGTGPASAQSYYDVLTHKPVRPIAPPECTKAAPILAVDKAEIHGISGDTAIVTAEGTALDDRSRSEKLIPISRHDGAAIYDFVACPPTENSSATTGVSAFLVQVSIKGIHRIIVRAQTNQRIIDVDAARRLPDPWSKPAPHLLQRQQGTRQ